MVVGENSELCSKVTVPPTVESPRRTATAHGEKREHQPPAGGMDCSRNRRRGGEKQNGKQKDRLGTVIGAFKKRITFSFFSSPSRCPRTCSK